MARYMLLAINGPKPGEGNDEAFTEWYNGTHLPEILGVDGIVSARRFKVLQGSMPQPYVAAYEIETDDLPAVLKRMVTDVGELHDTFDRDNSHNIVAIEITQD